MAYTPTPWVATDNKSSTTIRAMGVTPKPIAEIWDNGDDRMANAEFIVRAVNAHDELIKALSEGRWTASVYHCPPPRNRRDNPLKNAQSIRIAGTFPTEKEALERANAVIAEGRPSIDIFIHQPSAEASASFSLPQKALNALARAALDGERND